MDSEAKLRVLTNFNSHRLHLLSFPNSTKDLDNNYSQKEYNDSKAYINLLMQKPVSKMSKFSDYVWDFNDDYPNAARNVKGAKLRIDFSKYKNIPQFVLTEIKIIFELALLNNSIFRPKRIGKKSHAKGIIKANSLIPIFKNGLEFVNEIFKQTIHDLGYDFVKVKIKTLSDLIPTHYHKAAANYKRVNNRELHLFF